jgi:hypothetical protein
LPHLELVDPADVPRFREYITRGLCSQNLYVDP